MLDWDVALGDREEAREPRLAWRAGRSGAVEPAGADVVADVRTAALAVVEEPEVHARQGLAPPPRRAQLASTLGGARRAAAAAPRRWRAPRLGQPRADFASRPRSQPCDEPRSARRAQRPSSRRQRSVGSRPSTASSASQPAGGASASASHGSERLEIALHAAQVVVHPLQPDADLVQRFGPRPPGSSMAAVRMRSSAGQSVGRTARPASCATRAGPRARARRAPRWRRCDRAELERSAHRKAPSACVRSSERVREAVPALAPERRRVGELAAAFLQRQQAAGQVAAVDRRDVARLERLQRPRVVPVEQMPAIPLEALERVEARCAAAPARSARPT